MKKSKFFHECDYYFLIKTFRIMRVTIFLLLISILQVSANNAYSQKTKLSFDFSDKKMVDVLYEIEEQTGFYFLYNDNLIDTDRKINLSVEHQTIEKVLDELFSGTAIKYTVTDRKIILMPSQITASLQQEKSVSGRVTDATGAPLPGVTIVINGTSQGTITNEAGDYFISNVPPDATLAFSFVGMKTREIPVAGKTNIDVTMDVDAIGLGEVVAVGYGVQKKATLSGSVTNVQGAELVKTPVTNVSQTMAGRLPGLVAISGTGEPGYDGATLRIRGINTFGNAAPLIVVDGVPGRSLDRIDPATIEDISVIKDASAAIYGAQAANGVILITTKRGLIGTPSIKLSYNQGFAAPTVIPKMADAAEYATLLNEIDMYAGRDPRYTQDDIQKYRSGDDPWFYPNTDWFDETLRNWSPQNYGNISVSGGNQKIKYFVSVSEKSQEGFYKNSGTKYNQYDMKSNFDIKINDYLDLTINTTSRMEDRNFPTRSSQDIFRMVMRGKPNLPAYWPNGKPGPDIEYGNNPVVVSTKATGYDRDKNYVFNSDFGVNLKIPGIDGLSVKGNASIDKNMRFRKIWRTPWYLYSWDYKTYDENGDPVLVEGKKGYSEPRLSEETGDHIDILLNGLINYSKTFSKAHSINFLAGVERITGKGDLFSAFRRYYISPAIDQLFAGGQEELNNDGSGYEEARLNYFGRLNYSFNDKYLAEFVWRYQASYIFEETGRYGFFPGISLGYIISSENFWAENLAFINFAKIRASYGETGNDLINPYQYLTSYTINNLLFIDNNGTSANQALQEGVVPNKGVTWETAIQRNIGIDLQFLNGDLAVTTDYFKNKREDILWARNASVPNSTGMSLPDENIGKVENKGVDFNIEYRKRSNDFKYSIGLNGVYTKNKILFWDEPPGAPEYQQSTGRPIYSGLYYQAIGVFEDQAAVDAYPHWGGARPGDMIFEDYNHDGAIDANDRVRHSNSRTPKFTGGLNFLMNYKGFDLSMLFQGALGGVFYEGTESGDIGNFLNSFYEERWTPDAPNSEHPRTFNRGNEYWVNQQNTYWLHKTDYIRLKNIELGYTLPGSLTQRYLIQQLRLHVSAFNFMTYSPDMDDFDPENTRGDGHNYPLNKVLNVGLSVTF
ncbi:MAG: TonB-dependent receptor [Mangrovibacterium sp.]